MGGKLQLVAEFADRPAIELSGLPAVDSDKQTI